MQLTESQYKVYEHLLRGLSNAEIAATLGVRPKTIKFHLTSVYKKLGVSGDRELLAREVVKLLELTRGIIS